MDKRTEENFDLLLERILDTNKLSDIKKINKALKKIRHNVLCVGVGGSNVVSEYASLVFNHKNKCFVNNLDPRDSLCFNKTNVKNIFACSYSGNNYGIEMALKNGKKNYLLSNASETEFNCHLLQYQTSIKKEKSFISLAATLMPMSILLNYYLDRKGFEELVKEMFANIEEYNFADMPVYEMISGFDTGVADRYLETTLIEAGLADIVVHHKYSYCHGRTTSAHARESSLIYLCNTMSELDKTILKEAEKIYKEIIVLKGGYNDMVINNFDLCLKAMYLTRYLAELKGKSISKVDYSPVGKGLYRYKGPML